MDELPREEMETRFARALQTYCRRYSAQADSLPTVSVLPGDITAYGVQHFTRNAQDGLSDLFLQSGIQVQGLGLTREYGYRYTLRKAPTHAQLETLEALVQTSPLLGVSELQARSCGSGFGR